ncbi:hypothetical protein Tco_0857971 [Tanacetum coccineum]|uniref:Integrase, catalytic region, zinc finger, CCHC-type, peptidase aspartic, catalytic n=1 Tax=Tanacetum coccineum TaxID=301880 RepID=A0ABQ5BDH0_9ASTR
MTTLAEHIIVAGAKNRPPMLEKSMYDSWASRIRLFIKGKKHGETLYEYYWRFSQLINDMHTIGMTMQQVQVNTKFLNALPSEWSKFVTDVKLAKSLYTTNYDQLYAYLSQHERHANEVRISRERYPDSLAFVANSPTLYNPSQSPQHSGYSMYPPPQQFTPVYAAPIHHQHHHTLVNPQQHPVSPPPFISPSMTQQSQAEFPQLDSGLAVPMFQQREDPIECINKAMTFLSAVASRFPPSNNQLRTSSNPRNQATIQDDRVTVQSSRKTTPELCWRRAYGETILDEGQLAFLADPGISEALIAQQIIPHNSAFQIDDLDAYDSDCDDLSSAKAVLMANLLSCDPEVFFEVPYSDSYPNNMINQDVKEMQYSEQTHVDYFEDIEIHSESKQKESKYIDKEIVLEKQNKQLENIICKMYRSTQAMHMLTKPQVFYDDTHKQALGYQNPFHLKKAQLIQPTLYDGSVIAKEHVVIFMIDDEETLILEEESRSKMFDKQNDPISIEKKIKISPIDYSKLNKIKEDFGKHFVTKKELSAEQASWLKHSPLLKHPLRHIHLLASKLLVNFLRVLGFSTYKRMFYEIIEVQTIFNQIEADVDQCSVDKNVLEIQIKQLKIDNDQLLNQIMSQEIVHIVANSVNILDVKKENSGENLNAPTFNQLFEINELKAQSQEKDTVIRKLKERIKYLSGKDSVENVKKDIDEIEIINIELEHSVAKLLSKNENLRKEREHLKLICKDQFDLIRKTLVQSKEHCDSLIAQINAKSVENSDLNAQLQEKVFAITTLKNELRKLKRKNIVNTISFSNPF